MGSQWQAMLQRPFVDTKERLLRELRSEAAMTYNHSILIAGFVLSYATIVLLTFVRF